MDDPARLKDLVARRAAVTVPGAANALFDRLFNGEVGLEAAQAQLAAIRQSPPVSLLRFAVMAAAGAAALGVIFGAGQWLTLSLIALAAGLCTVSFQELSHVTVKRALTGNGAARKEQVKAMVCIQLGLKTPPEPDDVSDALALALVYALRSRSLSA